MKKVLKKTCILLALVTLIQAMLFNSGFAISKVNASAIINKNYWNYKNIGQTNEYSSADILSTNTVIVSGSGTGEFSTEDSFTYAYIPVQGDCVIKAKLASQSGSNSLSKAGLMIRENLNTDSRNSFLAVNRNNEILYQNRALTGGQTTASSITTGSIPVFLELRRTGNNFEAFKSNDGTTWTKIGDTQNIDMNSKVYIGFASTTSTPATLCTARFENIDVQYTDETPPSAPTNLISADFDEPYCLLKWDEADDNAGTVLYEVYSNGKLYKSTNDCSINCTNAYFGKSNKYSVVAVDAAGNKSIPSDELSIVTQNATVASADVKNIRLNSIGLDRLNSRRQQQNKPLVEVDPVQVGEEVLTDDTLNNVLVQGNSLDLNTIYAESLPAFIDNSTLPCFPKIGHQIYGDCSIWSSTYYTMTHMVGLAKINAGEEWDAKNDTSGSKTFSPKFAYSIGAAPYRNSIQGIYKTLMESGSATLADVPYFDDGEEGKKVCTDLSAWENAINYRIDKCGYIEADEDNLSYIKQLLNNGYVLTFGTAIGSFEQYPDTILDNPDPTVNDDYMVGKNFFYRLNGGEGGHQMTLVGYDDNIWWGDVNGDGIPQPEEKGIFKIANSWGEDYGENGYSYVTYDSMYRSSKFSQFNTPIWKPVFRDNLVWLTPKRNYQPQMIAEFTVSHAKAKQLRIAVGYSETDKTLPEAYFYPSSLNNLPYEAPFDFNPGGTASDGSFAVDLTDFITKFNLEDNKEYRWYLLAGDKNADGSPVTMKSFKVHDKRHDTYAVYSGPVLQNDGGNSLAYMDYGWLTQKVGDLDGNGIIDHADYLLMWSYIQREINDFPVEHDMWAADVNGDGIIDVFDAVLIWNYELGNITAFPKEQR